MVGFSVIVSLPIGLMGASVGVVVAFAFTFTLVFFVSLSPLS